MRMRPRQSPIAGDVRRDGSSAKKVGDDNNDEDATGKPNSPGPRNESCNDSTTKKDDAEETTAKPHTRPGKLLKFLTVHQELVICLLQFMTPIFCSVTSREMDHVCSPHWREEVRRAIVKFVTNGKLGEFSIGNDTRMTLQLFLRIDLVLEYALTSFRLFNLNFIYHCTISRCRLHLSIFCVFVTASRLVLASKPSSKLSLMTSRQ